MKKRYEKPEIILVDIELQKMIATSRTEKTADPTEEVLSRESNGWERRGRNDWDDEEDEDW
jgi:hypothetical protein